MKKVFLSLLVGIIATPVFEARAAETLVTSFSVALAEDAVYSADGSEIWIVSYGDQKLYKYSTSTRTVLGSVALGATGYSGVMTPDGSKIYVNLISTNAVAVVNTVALTKTNITTSSSTWGITMSPAGDYVYVTSGGGVVQKISTTSDSVISTTSLPTTGQTRDIKMSSDGNYLYVNDWNNGKLYKLNASDLSVAASLSIPGATFIAISPSASYGFVMPYTGSNIYKFSTSTMSLISTISGFSSAAEAMFSNDGLYLYVQNAGNGSFSKMRLSDNTIVSTFGSAVATAFHAALSPNGNEMYQMSTAGTVYVYDLGNPVISTISLTLPTNATYRTNTNLTANFSSNGGLVTFYANGKYIPRCIKILVAAGSATCTFKPSIHGVISISAVGTVSGQSAKTFATLNVEKRTNKR
jgi:hypothetical protein